MRVTLRVQELIKLKESESIDSSMMSRQII